MGPSAAFSSAFAMLFSCYLLLLLLNGNVILSQTPNPASSETKTLNTTVTEGTVIHLWLRAQQEGQVAVVFSKFANGKTSAIASTTEADPRWFDFKEIALEYEGEVQLFWSEKSTNVSYVYAYEPEKVYEEGIRVLNALPAAEHAENITNFHFKPPLGWMNDPNGFSRSADGIYHLFYQFYPHSQQWWAMHWGHAVSTDLFNWIHLPVMIRPTKDQMNGGIFSGSAYPVGNGLRIYYADNSKYRDPLEFERSVLTKDLISPIGPKVTAIARPGPELNGIITQDFRDPNIFIGPGNQLYMVLASRFANLTAGVVLLYKHNPSVAEEPKGWEFQNFLISESRWSTDSAECAGLIPLGNPFSKNTLWVLAYGAQNALDNNGRTYPSPGILGTFDGKTFIPISERLLDFISGSYGFQGFYDARASEALLIGWLSNWRDVDPHGETPTTQSVPRLIKLTRDRRSFLTPPHPNIRKFHDQKLDAAALKQMKPVKLPCGTADVEVRFSSEQLNSNTTSLTLVMNHTEIGAETVKIILTNKGVEAKLRWRSQSDNPSFTAAVVNASKLRVLIDLRSVEIFVDDGLVAGTTRIPTAGHIESIQFVGPPNVLKSAKIYSMKSTQQQPNLK